MPRGWRAACGLLALALWQAGCPAAELPARMAWVWDRPQPALPWPAEVGVAYQQATVRLSGASAQVRLRRWPLPLPAHTVPLPVVHVSLDALHPPRWDAAQQALVRQAVLAAWGRSPSGWVQIDLEARPSQRAGYLALLQSLQAQRQQVQPQTGQPLRLSVTALASWCMGDPWLPAALVDEIVPMYFHMGRDGPRIRTQLAQQGQASVAACRASSGWLLGERLALPAAQGQAHRLYHFNTRAWQAADWPLLRP